MSKSSPVNSTVIHTNSFTDSVNPSEGLIRPKSMGDFPDVPKVYFEVAKNYSSARLIGPPLCDELIALLQHMYTEEEASIVRHIKPFRTKTAESLARAEHRPLKEMKKILEHLANDKFVLLSFGKTGKKRYVIMPIIPGTFEWVIIHPTEDKIPQWHRRFAELFEALFETGYHLKFFTKFREENGYPPVRYLPVEQSIEAQPMALPADHLEEILDPYDQFGVGVCQCRMTKKIVGSGCGKPLEVCTGFGPTVDIVIQKGKMRRAEKREIIEIKREAEANGLITWMMNVDEKTAKIGNASCSCCSCCCPMLRSIKEYNIPGLIAPPHFMPLFDDSKCVYCGKCEKVCQMGAIHVDAKAKTLTYQRERCIGCGQCVVACKQNYAITMEPMSNYKKAPKSWPLLGVKMFPGLSRITWNIWKGRK